MRHEICILKWAMTKYALRILNMFMLRNCDLSCPSPIKHCYMPWMTVVFRGVSISTSSTNAINFGLILSQVITFHVRRMPGNEWVECT